MSFFYNLNKRLADLAAKQDAAQIAESKKAEAVAQSPLTQALNESAIAERSTGDYSAKKARAGKDIGKPGKAFAKIAQSAGKKYGSKAAGERVAGAVLNKLRHPKEDIENEGNAFTGALAKTPKGGKFKVGNKEFTDTSDLEEGYAEMDAWLKSREKEKGTGKFDVKDTGYSKRYTRKAEPEADDEEEKSAEPKRRGRPAGAPKGPERTTKGAWKHKGERKVKEAAGKCCPHCGESLEEELDEKAPPGAKAERMVKHIKKAYSKDGKLTPKEKSIAYATAWKAKKAGKVEEEGKPDFLDLDKDGNKAEPMKQAAKQAKSKKKEEVEETTVAGSVATATTSGKSNKGGMQFGKGVYESLDQQFRQALTESISVEESVEECGMEGTGPALVIKADGEEAAKLMALLKLAGLQERQEVCPHCGSADCQCEELDENSPDWPTNTETSADAFQYSGGLNKPKSTGQTTTPTLGSADLRRQVSMEESVELERSLFKLYKDMSGK